MRRGGAGGGAGGGLTARTGVGHALLVAVACLLGAAAAIPASTATPSPIVMIPGILCSQLETSLRNASVPGGFGCRKDTHGEHFTTWITPAALLRGVCFAGHMNLTRGPAASSSERAANTGTANASCVRDPRGVSMRPPAFGNTTAFDQLNPQYPFGPREELFLGLTEGLKAAFGGHYYREGETLRGAPYDWRKYGDACYTSDFFASLANLVEETVERNGRAVTLLCHSMGCNVAHYFLAAHASDDWKRRHVDRLLALAPSFAGAPVALHNYLFGTPYDFVPGFASVFRYWPSLSVLLPFELSSREGDDALRVWDRTTLVAAQDRNYTGTTGRGAGGGRLGGGGGDGDAGDTDVVAAILSRAARDERKRPGLGVASEHFWPEQGPYMRSKLVDKGPGVPTHCLYLSQVPTMLGMEVKGDDLEEMAGTFVGAGDGDVVAESVEKACNVWNALPGGHPTVVCEEVKTRKFADHQSMLWAPEIVKRVLELVGETAARPGSSKERVENQRN